MINIDTNIETPAVDSSAEEQPIVEVDSSEQKPVSTDNSSSESGSDFFDPNQVPEELKPAYKQMQAAWTKKTQELATQRKEFESANQKAQAYDKYAQYLPVLDEMMAKKQSTQESPEMVALTQRLKAAGYNDDAIEMMKVGAQFTLEQFNTFSKQQEINSFTQTVQSNINEAGKLDPRLNDEKLVYQTADGEKITFGQMVEELVAASPNWEKDVVAATRKAINKVDALIGRAKTEGKQELSAAAKGQAAKFPQTNSSSQGAVDRNKATTFQEAYKEALQEVGE